MALVFLFLILMPIKKRHFDPAKIESRNFLGLEKSKAKFPTTIQIEISQAIIYSNKRIIWCRGLDFEFFSSYYIYRG